MVIPVLGDLIDGVKDVISEVVVDKDKRDQVNLELKKLEDQAQARIDAQITGQLDVNKVEASNGSVFVAGWRPFIGWVGGVGLGMQSIVLPLVTQITGHSYEMNTELLIMTLGSMLGIGSMRTYEKVKGVSTNDYRSTPSEPASTTVETTPDGGVTVETKGAASTAPTTPVKSKKKFKIF